jgi:hypothetical protein
MKPYVPAPHVVRARLRYQNDVSKAGVAASAIVVAEVPLATQVSDAPLPAGSCETTPRTTSYWTPEPAAAAQEIDALSPAIDMPWISIGGGAGDPAAQAPAWQLSPTVQLLPSLQGVPLDTPAHVTVNVPGSTLDGVEPSSTE